MPPSKRRAVAIIGAGPAGCTLARLIQCANAPIDVTIFESDASLSARSQGGTLDLHTDTGLAALRKGELYAEFLKHARFEGNGEYLSNDHSFRY
jgi:2-polyprenyl-6-methoxyphenol hydroxylase-like FAD-dependent oxidoreductase